MIPEIGVGLTQCRGVHEGMQGRAQGERLFQADDGVADRPELVGTGVDPAALRPAALAPPALRGRGGGVPTPPVLAAIRVAAVHHNADVAFRELVGEMPEQLRPLPCHHEQDSGHVPSFFHPSLRRDVHHHHTCTQFLQI